jgi:hypothetical protein
VTALRVELHDGDSETKPHLLIGNCIFCHKPAVIMLDPQDMPGVEAYRLGEPVQVAFPHWDKAKRELLISGTHEHCWELLPDEDPEEDY